MIKLQQANSSFYRLFIALLVLAFPSHIYAESSFKIVGAGRVEQPLPPYAWINQCTGENEGSMRQLVTRVFKDIGITLEIVDIDNEGNSFRQAMQSYYQLLEEEQIDFFPTMKLPIPSITYSKNPIMTLRSSAVVLTSHKDVTEVTELKGERGLIISGNFSRGMRSLEERLNKAGLSYTSVTSSDEGFNQIVNGEADYLISDHYASMIRLEESGYQNLKVVDLELPGQQFFLATKEGSRGDYLMPAIDNRLRYYRDIGYYEHLNVNFLKRWTNSQNCE